MKKYIVLFSMFGVLSLIIACGTSKKTTHITDTKTGEATPKEYALADIEAGKGLWAANCGKCHSLYAANAYTITEWQDILPRMYKRMKLKNRTDVEKINAYLYSNAKR